MVLRGASRAASGTAFAQPQSEQRPALRREGFQNLCSWSCFGARPPGLWEDRRMLLSFAYLACGVSTLGSCREEFRFAGRTRVLAPTGTEFLTPYGVRGLAVPD